MNIEALKLYKKALEEEIFQIECIINKHEKRTADGFPIEIGKVYYYQNAADLRKEVVFDESAKFGDDVVWIKEAEGVQAGLYYRNLYVKQKEKPKSFLEKLLSR